MRSKQFLLTALFAVTSVFTAVAQQYTKYLFVYFPSNDNENIYYALSDKDDPFNFVPMNGGQMVISADSIALKKGVRDPHVLRGEDGWFYMVNTDMRCSEGWSSNRGIVLMRSKDLVNWQHSTVHFPEKYKGTNFANVTRVWAPETIWDPVAKKYLVYFSLLTNDGTIPYDKVFYCYANEDFTDLEGEPTYFYDRGSATIDMDIVYNEKDQLYHGFYKNEGTGGICKVTASRLTAAEGQEPGSQWSEPSSTLQQTNVAVEGAGVWRLIDSDTWILMYDCYGSGYYQFCESTDLLNFKLKAQTNTSGMFTPRHGTVLPVTDEEVKAIEKAFGNDLESRTEQVKDATIDNPVLTTFVVNGQMNLGSSGWTSTTGARNQGTATNQKGAFEGAFFENWNPTSFAGKMYQTVENIPNGTYELRIAAFVYTLGEEGVQYVYAGSEQQNLTAAEPTAYNLVFCVTDNQVEIGLCQTEAVNGWMGIDCVSLTYYGAGDNVEAVKQRVAERLRAEMVAPLREEMVNAVRLGIDVSAAETLIQRAELKKEEVDAEIVRLKIEEYQKVMSRYTEDVTSLLGSWTMSNVNTGMSGQHWDGTKGSSYYEQFDGWAFTAWQMSMQQSVTLPQGSYVLKVACRSSSAAVKAEARVGDVSVAFPTKGDTGLGITTDGVSCFETSGDVTFANKGAGCGWEWRYVPFTVSDDNPVEVQFSGVVTDCDHQWMSFTSISLLTFQVAGIDPNLLNTQPVSPSAVYNLGGRPTSKAKRASTVVIEKGKKHFSR